MGKKIKLNIKKYFSRLKPREKKLLGLMILSGILILLNGLSPKITQIYEMFTAQEVRLETAKKDIEHARKIVTKYLEAKSKQSQIEKKFEKNEIKEGHLSYVDSLKSSDMMDFQASTPQERDFGKDFNQVTFKISFKATSLVTIMNFIKKLENEKRKYLISELSIKKAYGSLTVVIEVNSIEKKK